MHIKYENTRIRTNEYTKFVPLISIVLRTKPWPEGEGALGFFSIHGPEARGSG